jgi:hypothetical protein
MGKDEKPEHDGEERNGRIRLQKEYQQVVDPTGDKRILDHQFSIKSVKSKRRSTEG